MFTAVAGVIGALTVGAWSIVAWASNRKRSWLMFPIALAIVFLVYSGLPGWAFLAIIVLLGGTFAELVIGGRESPVLCAKTPDAPLSTERWAVAVAAPFRVALAEPWDVIVRPQLRRQYRAVFRSEWGIVDRPTLLAAIERLWSELHTESDTNLVVDLRTGTVHVYSTDSPEQERALLLTPDHLARFREITGVEESAETVIISTCQWWKAVHVIRLACGGATLNWLSQAEAQNLLRRIASDLQRRYASWQQLTEAFHMGYLLWHEQQLESTTSSRLWTALGMVARDPTSPWNLLPWDMPLERAPGGEFPLRSGGPVSTA